MALLCSQVQGGRPGGNAEAGMHVQVHSPDHHGGSSAQEHHHTPQLTVDGGQVQCRHTVLCSAVYVPAGGLRLSNYILTLGTPYCEAFFPASFGESARDVLAHSLSQKRPARHACAQTYLNQKPPLRACIFEHVTQKTEMRQLYLHCPLISCMRTFLRACMPSSVCMS